MHKTPNLVCGPTYKVVPLAAVPVKYIDAFVEWKSTIKRHLSRVLAVQLVLVELETEGDLLPTYWFTADIRYASEEGYLETFTKWCIVTDRDAKALYRGRRGA